MANAPGGSDLPELVVTSPSVPRGNNGCPPSRVYDLITEKIEEPDAPIGLFAYAIYKKEKMAEINRLTTLHGRSPTNQEMQPFVKNAEIRIDSFIEQAEIRIAEFQEDHIAEYLEQLNAEYSRKYAEEIQRFQPQPQPSWVKQSLYGLSGNILTVIITFILFAFGVVVLEGVPSFVSFLIRTLQHFIPAT